MSIARNEPCPCGSGKKYKKCCIHKLNESSNELFWRRVGKINQDLTSKILAHTVKHFGPDAIDDAWEEFIGDTSEPFDLDHRFLPIFFSWFFYNWEPDAFCENDLSYAGIEDQPALFFLKKQEKKLTPLECAYINASLRESLTFFEVVNANPGQGFRLRDILMGAEQSVVEKLGSENAKPGDIIFGKCVTVDNLTILETCAHFLIDPIHKLNIIDLRNHIEKIYTPISREALRDYDFEILKMFFDIEQLSFNPDMQFQNTSGESLRFSKVIFKIDSMEQAFDALKHLAGNKTDSALLESAERNADGWIKKLKFDWIEPGNSMMAQWDNTIQGEIIIEKAKLTIMVNSVERADRIKAIVSKKLPGAIYKATVIESVEAKLKDFQNQKSSPAAQAQEKKNQELAAMPEVKQAMDDMLRSHYENWLDTALPALNDKTPRQAVRTKNGKEKVEALLLHLERLHKNGAPLPQGTLEHLRRQLDLV